MLLSRRVQMTIKRLFTMLNKKSGLLLVRVYGYSYGHWKSSWCYRFYSLDDLAIWLSRFKRTQLDISVPFINIYLVKGRRMSIHQIEQIRKKKNKIIYADGKMNYGEIIINKDVAKLFESIKKEGE